MQFSNFEILKGLRKRFLYLCRAGIAIGVVVMISPGRAGQGGGQQRAFDDGGRGGKLNFKPQTRSVLSDF